MNSAREQRRQRERIADEAARWVARRDAGLTPSERAEFALWCAADSRHVAAVEHYAKTWSVLDRPQQAEAVRGELRTRARKRRQRNVLLGSAAAIGLLAFFLVSPGQKTTDAPPLTAAASASGVLLTPETRTLTDGSVVELNRGAEISVEFTPALRRVILQRGEAHFAVAKNPARPFVVVAGGTQVRAVGTAFSVQRNSGNVEVLVTEGKIAVEQPAHEAVGEAAPLAFVAAGERIVVPAEATLTAPAAVAVSAEEAAARLVWRAPRVEFSETPLAEAVALMNRSARGLSGPGLELVIDPASRALAREPVSGIFRVDNTEAFVRVLELSLGVKTERRGSQLVMRRAE